MLEDCQAVLTAHRPSDLFGTNEKRSKIVFRRLARAVHPDMYPDNEKDVAQKAFVKLSLLWEKYQTLNSPDKGSESNTIVTRRAKYTLGESFSTKGVFSRYNASYDDGHESCQILITKSPKNSDLASSYSQALKTLKQEVPENFRGFYPELIEAFKYRTPDNTDHPAIVQSIPGGFVPFSEILRVYPQGIGGRDIAWIFKRVLTALGNAHDVGLVHGAATLNSFWIDAEKHGVILSEWQHSVTLNEPLKIIDTHYKEDYPQSVFDKEPANHHADIYVAAKMMNRLLRDDTPKPLRIFFKSCLTVKNLDAKHLLREFDYLLERMYGKPKYNPFTLNP